MTCESLEESQAGCGDKSSDLSWTALNCFCAAFMPTFLVTAPQFAQIIGSSFIWQSWWSWPSKDPTIHGQGWAMSPKLSQLDTLLQEVESWADEAKAKTVWGCFILVLVTTLWCLPPRFLALPPGLLFQSLELQLLLQFSVASDAPIKYFLIKLPRVHFCHLPPKTPD